MSVEGSETTVDVDALRSFLEEIYAWQGSGSSMFWRIEEHLKELREWEGFQERAKAFDIECDGAPLSRAWFKAVQEQYPEARPKRDLS